MKKIALLIWLVGLAAAIVVIGHTRLSTDMSAFLPRNPSAQQQVLMDQLHDGAVSRILLLGITGATPDQLATLSKAFAQTLRHEPDLASVSNGEMAAFAADKDFLWQNRYLLNDDVTAAAFTADGLHKALVTDLTMLRSNMYALVEPLLAADPTGELIHMVTGMGGGAHPTTRGGVWMSKDGARAVLMVQTRAPGFDIDAQQRALETIARDFAATKQATGIASATLLQSGAGVFAVDSRDRMKRDATRFSVIATLLVSCIVLAAYRSPRVLILTLLPVASGALAGMAAVSLGFGYVHGITLGFGVTLIGEAVDYSVYLFTQTAPGTTPKQTLPRIWPTLLLGMATSVVGFSAMLFSSFSGFAQLGLFTITGLIVALCVTRFVLPLLLPQGFAAKTVTPPFLPRLLTTLTRLRALPFLLALAAIAALCLHRGTLWQDQISSMNPLPADQLALNAQLRQDTGAPDMRYLLAITAPDLQQALQQSETIAAALQIAQHDKAIDGFDFPGRYLPSDAVQNARQAALPDTVTLQSNLAAATTGLPFQPGLFHPFLDDVEKARTQTLITRATLDGTTLALKLDSLLVLHGDAWRAMLPLTNVQDPARLAAIAAANNATLIDMKAQSDDLLHEYRHEAITLSIIGGIAIVALLAASLRSATRVMRVILPLALAVIVTAALFTLGAQKLSIFTLFGLLLTVAIGSNYCLFFERQRRDPDHHQRTALSLFLANLCTVIGFGILSFSGIPVLQGIGGTVAVGAALGLMFAAMLIPERAAR